MDVHRLFFITKYVTPTMWKSAREKLKNSDMLHPGIRITYDIPSPDADINVSFEFDGGTSKLLSMNFHPNLSSQHRSYHYVDFRQGPFNED